jgi:hypothetical protein
MHIYTYIHIHTVHKYIHIHTIHKYTYSYLYIDIYPLYKQPPYSWRDRLPNSNYGSSSYMHIYIYIHINTIHTVYTYTYIFKVIYTPFISNLHTPEVIVYRIQTMDLPLICISTYTYTYILYILYIHTHTYLKLYIPPL